LSSRCDTVEGNVLTAAVPSGADAYVMKLVLHGKTDDEAVAILRNCRAAMLAHAKLLVIERMLPEQIDPNDAEHKANFIADLNMMLIPGGQERTQGEYSRLFMAAGLRLGRVVPTTGTSAIVEAVPA